MDHGACDFRFSFKTLEFLIYTCFRLALNHIRQIGKVVGGTKGNKILDYVSVAPNKAVVTEDPPNPLDYDELVKYGYGHLVTRIMNAGGRNRMYQLLDMTPPSIKTKVVKVAPPIVIDREGKETRYQGLKLGQVLDDSIQAAALQDVQRRIEQGERVASSKVWDEVEAYEMPFADKRNTGPKQTPDWTVEQLDAWGKQQGRVESWARKARQGAYVNDPLESLDSLTLEQRLFSILTAFVTTVSFGKATPNFVRLIGMFVTKSSDSDNGIVLEDTLAILQIPAVLLLVVAVGSSLFCGIKAPEKNRSPTVWGIKGILGGPFAIQQLLAASTRITQQEQDDIRKQDASNQP
jgi:hypothetical protein